MPGPFGASIRGLLLYLHHSRHVGFERLSRMMVELFGLRIFEGAIANAFRRVGTAITVLCAAIREKLAAPLRGASAPGGPLANPAFGPACQAGRRTSRPRARHRPLRDQKKGRRYRLMEPPTPKASRQPFSRNRRSDRLGMKSPFNFDRNGPFDVTRS